MTDQNIFSTEGTQSAKQLSRRDFLRIVACAGIATWVGKAGLENLEAERVVRQSQALMGTVVNLTVIASDRRSAAAAEVAVDACLERMAELEAVLSRFKESSQVSILNRDGRLKIPHPALLEVIRQAQQISELSSGLFDITILPLLALYQKYHAAGSGLPTESEIQAACRKVDYRKVTMDENGLSLAETGMGITLDGIAKGYIVDQGVSRLVERGFSNVLVEAGGDLVAGGRQSFDRGWKIGVQSPRQMGEQLITRLDVCNEAIATSGDYMQPFTIDFAQHHILNPKTGRSSPALASATVIAPCLALADAVATALMVMEPPKGLELVRELGLRALLVTKDMTLLRA
jgi:thiamine biosynthesis lipoprotein